jgi:galactoside O-acetyltransferase
MEVSAYSLDDLQSVLGSVGDDVQIHKSVLFFGPENIFISSHVRIDCHCILSAGKDGVYIGRNVHIAAGVYVFGSSARVELQDFCGLSSRVILYTASDDYSKGAMTNPTIPSKYRDVISGPVVMKKHALVGAGSVVLPGVTLGFGSSVGALSLIHRDTPDFSIVAGSPARPVGTRSDRLRELELEFLAETSGQVEQTFDTGN